MIELRKRVIVFHIVISVELNFTLQTFLICCAAITRAILSKMSCRGLKKLHNPLHLLPDNQLKEWMKLDEQHKSSPFKDDQAHIKHDPVSDPGIQTEPEM